jgi:DNA-binding CsgD family transcriptional regulator
MELIKNRFFINHREHRVHRENILKKLNFDLNP